MESTDSSTRSSRLSVSETVVFKASSERLCDPTRWSSEARTLPRASSFCATEVFKVSNCLVWSAKRSSKRAHHLEQRLLSSPACATDAVRTSNRLAKRSSSEFTICSSVCFSSAAAAEACRSSEPLATSQAIPGRVRAGRRLGHGALEDFDRAGLAVHPVVEGSHGFRKQLFHGGHNVRGRGHFLELGVMLGQARFHLIERPAVSEYCPARRVSRSARDCFNSAASFGSTSPRSRRAPVTAPAAIPATKIAMRGR